MAYDNVGIQKKPYDTGISLNSHGKLKKLQFHSTTSGQRLTKQLD